MRRTIDQTPRARALPNLELKLTSTAGAALKSSAYATPRREEDGRAWAQATLGQTLRQAREQAGLTQMALAKRLKRSQTLVARVELGEVSADERYVKAVLKACRLPADWSPGARKG